MGRIHAETRHSVNWRAASSAVLGAVPVGIEEATMHTGVPLPVSCKPAPWNKGRLIGQKRLSNRKMSGPFAFGFSCGAGNEISPCSTSRSTASSEAAISSACRSTTFWTPVS
jgi:hypothetical protein